MSFHSVITGIINSIEAILPILIPAFLASVSSLWDGTYIRPEFGYKGKFTAKVCYSSVAFDVWAISGIAQSDTLQIPMDITRNGLTWSILFLTGMHLTFQYLCLNRTSGRFFKWTRVLMALFSVGVPLILLFPPSYIGY